MFLFLMVVTMVASRAGWWRRKGGSKPRPRPKCELGFELTAEPGGKVGCKATFKISFRKKRDAEMTKVRNTRKKFYIQHIDNESHDN